MPSTGVRFPMPQVLPHDKTIVVTRNKSSLEYLFGNDDDAVGQFDSNDTATTWFYDDNEVTYSEHVKKKRA